MAGQGVFSSYTGKKEWVFGLERHQLYMLHTNNNNQNCQHIHHHLLSYLCEEEIRYQNTEIVINRFMLMSFNTRLRESKNIQNTHNTVHIPHSVWHMDGMLSSFACLISSSILPSLHTHTHTQHCTRSCFDFEVLLDRL